MKFRIKLKLSLKFIFAVLICCEVCCVRNEVLSAVEPTSKSVEADWNSAKETVQEVISTAERGFGSMKKKPSEAVNSGQAELNYLKKTVETQFKEKLSKVDVKLNVEDAKKLPEEMANTTRDVKESGTKMADTVGEFFRNNFKNFTKEMADTKQEVEKKVADFGIDVIKSVEKKASAANSADLSSHVQHAVLIHVLISVFWMIFYMMC